jgi:hypothetical protein
LIITLWSVIVVSVPANGNYFIINILSEYGKVYLCCSDNNDLYRVLKDNKVPCKRFKDPVTAVNTLPDGSGLMILADNYPFKRTQIDPDLFTLAAEKDIRIYVEFPQMIPDFHLGDNAFLQLGYYGAVRDRMVISSGFFGEELPSMSILEMKDCHYIPVDMESPDLVLACVEGYNTAVYGLPEKMHPILFKHPSHNLLVATTKLSQFVSGRYMPNDAWPHVITKLVRWTSGDNSIPTLKWVPTVRPMHSKSSKLGYDARKTAIKRGVDYYSKSGLYLSPDWPKQLPPGNDSLPRYWIQGDGSHGIGECFISKMIFQNGRQAVSREARADCNLEAAMGLACGVALFNDLSNLNRIKKLSDFVFLNSTLAQGDRANPEKSSYGLLGWSLSSPESYWGDDNARALISAIATSGLTQTDSWDEFIVRGILANFRTTGINGFRPANVNGKVLEEKGWQHYFESDKVILNPHMEAYLWITYLWLYSKTGFKPLLERTKTGFEKMMNAYPEWELEANRFEQERCRMLFPLAWLVRVEDTPKHRAWLDTIAQYVINIQHTSGAIPQIPGSIVASNEGYGTGECALSHKEGDPVTDALYSINFAFIGMHEAAAATGNKAYAKSAEKMADFFVRTQTQSQVHQELDGTWYRGFDYEKWDYWGSDGDWGWGVWTNEIGWTHSWITATLALLEMKTSLWDIALKVDVSPYFDHYRKMMLPDVDLQGFGK